MVATAFAESYATALLDLARERGCHDEVRRDCAALADLLAAEPGLRVGLVSPGLGREATEALLRGCFADRIEPLVLDFVLLIAARGRLDQLAGILAGVEALARREEGRFAVEVRSAVEPDAANRSRLEAVLRGRFGAGIELLWSVDPSLLGGFIVRAGGRLLDASVKRKLAHMRRLILDIPFKAEGLWSAQADQGEQA